MYLINVNPFYTSIRNALEFAIASYTPGGYVRTFLQMSGARVVYNLQKSPGERVKSVEVLCANCTVPQYEAIDDYKTYGVIIDQFLLRGGDGFTMFNVRKHFPFEINSI